MSAKHADPRIALVVDIMRRARAERAKRLITVGDMRRKDSRVRMSEEAEMIIAALDGYDVKAFEAAISSASEPRP